MTVRQISLILTSAVVVISAAFCSNASGQVFRELNMSKVNNPAPGYFIFSPNAGDSISMMDQSGKNLFKLRVGPHSNFMEYNGKWYTYFTGSNGKTFFLRRDILGNVLDTLRVTAEYQTDFHECRIISDTSYLILGVDDRITDLSGIIPGAKTNATVLFNVIQERTFSGNLIFSWNSFDHIPVTDAADGVDLLNSLVDYMHVNSIWKDDDGNYLVSCRHLDEIIKINRQSGEIMWRLGGSKSKNNEFQFLNDTTDGFFGFSHQHSASRTSAGTILMFDNGNLKPAPQTSRAVEYEVDEIAKTVRRVFEYRPNPTRYAAAMGSAQELENGNILIGYGSSGLGTVAHEVSRDGTIQIQADAPATSGVTPYRFTKGVFGMTGAYRRVTNTGGMTFTRGDSTTHLTVAWSRVDDTTSAVAERHAYMPHAIAFANETGCAIIDTRWIFRVKDTALVAGTMTFDIGSVPGIDAPADIKLYHRVKEGQGDFNLVTTTYSSATKKLSVNRLLTGEFLIAYDQCFAPTLLSPANVATEVGPTPMLQWSKAVTTGDYQVEVSTVPTFLTVVSRIITRRLDTTLAAIPDFTTIYWRVRGKRIVGYGPWSEVFKFTTRLGISTLISPIIVRDTIAILPTHVFKWSTATGALRYRITITGFGAPFPSIDTIITGTQYSPGIKLFPNTQYTWQIYAVNDTIVGRPSTIAFFVTSPVSPRLTMPAHDAVDIATENQLFAWDEVASAIRYVVTVIRLADNTVIKMDSVTRPPLTISSLPAATRLSWTCRAVGRYGAGPDAQLSPFTTSSDFVLSAPRTIQPKRVNNVDTQNVQFTWTGVELAEYYDLQITSKQSFTAPETQIFRLEQTNWTMPVLKAGANYGWRVIGYNNTSNGRWSDTATFSTIASPSQGLVPISPVLGATDVAPSGLFAYTTSPKYSSYDVFVDTDPEFATPEFRFASSIGTAAFSGLRDGTHYYWRVVGKKFGQPDEFGTTSDFMTRTVTSVATEEGTTGNSFQAYFAGEDLVISANNSVLAPITAKLYALHGTCVLSVVNIGAFPATFAVNGLTKGAYHLIIEAQGASPFVIQVLRR
ncbi:MAG: aryl-sulfate sulfotransferase [Candidatus Kapabacteria bacterium]|nr:aryl-sulfate sulfotransferase [Candidatus Kapabacteria bacterium]